MVRLVGARKADLVVEAHQAVLAEIELPAKVQGAAHLLARQQSAAFIPAHHIERGYVLVAPGDEGDAAAGRGHPEWRFRLDRRKRGSARRNRQKLALLGASQNERGARAVIGGAAQAEPVIVDAPPLLSCHGVEREGLTAFGDDHEIPGDER